MVYAEEERRSNYVPRKNYEKGFKKRNPLGCVLAEIETGKTILSAAYKFLALWLGREADPDSRSKLYGGFEPRSMQQQKC